MNDYLRKQYPDLYEVYDKSDGDKTLRAKADEMFDKIRPLREALETFDEEEERGIMHYVPYCLKMEEYRKQIPVLEAEAKTVMDKWLASKPPYDPDNHVGSCGCIRKNGERVYWCGDHY